MPAQLLDGNLLSGHTYTQLGNATTGNTVVFNATNTGADTILGGTGNDLVQFAKVAYMALESSINGGAGTNTIAFTSGTVTSTDAQWTKVSNIQTLTLGGVGGDSIDLSTTAFAAGLTSITGGTGADTINVLKAPTNGLTFNASAGGGGVSLLGSWMGSAALQAPGGESRNFGVFGERKTVLQTGKIPRSDAGIA